MITIKPQFVIETPVNGQEILKHIEKVGRVCYKSEDRITDTSAEKFVAMIIKHGHEAVIEHFSITVKLIIDRAVSMEVVRHRMASYAQESTRYCNYSKDKFDSQITFIEPSFWDINNPADREKYKVWKEAMEYAEAKYLELIELGATPQEARSVLPNSLKTELMMTLNLRSWRNYFRLRCSPQAHPDIRAISIPLLHKFKELIPVVFDDINY